MAGRLTKLQIFEVSGVDAPAAAMQGDPEGKEPLAKGWLVCKSRDGHVVSGPLFPNVSARAEIAALVEKTKTPALTPPPPAERGGDTALEVYRADDGTIALTMPDCEMVKVLSPRGSVEVTKASLRDAEARAIEPGLSFAPAEEVRRNVQDVIAKAHHSSRQGRDEKGMFRGRFFQRAQSRPKLAGTTFFR